MIAAVNRESQTVLAKLLAKENLQVTIGNYKTAFFDVKNRVLGLPTWNTDNKGLSDLLIGHEVGHALYTPSDAVTRFKERFPNLPFDIGNIVEDIRIERLIRNTYPGLVLSFKNGYHHFIEKDFFKISGVDLSTLGFADRLNLHAKIGHSIDVPLNAEEMVIYKRCFSAETYDEVLQICEDIAEMIKGETAKNQQSDELQDSEDSADFDMSDEDSESQDSNGEDSSTSDEDNRTSKNDASSDDNDAHESSHEAGQDNMTMPDNLKSPINRNTSPKLGDLEKDGGNSDFDKELQSKTMREAEKNLQDIQARETTHVMCNKPHVQSMMSTVVPVEEVMSARRHDKYRYDTIMTNEDIVKDWTDFSASTKKHVAILVKEFERRKAAYQYSRATRSTTGSIDVNRLHSYRFEDQIFKSVTRLTDAKNHGMVFFIDYSGSMRDTIGRVIVQTLQLVTFCKAVGIPFEVYGFTSRYSNPTETQCVLPGYNMDFSDTIIFQLLHSRMSRPDFDTACRELKAQTVYNDSFSCGVLAFNSKYEIMNGTPLNETIIIAHEIVRSFRERHKVQKMNTIFLTDGESGNVRYRKNEIGKNYEYENPNVWNSIKVLPLYGKNIEMVSRNSTKSLYVNLITSLRKTCDTTVIGFFIASYKSDYKNNCITALRTRKPSLSWSDAVTEFSVLQKTAKKEKCLAIKGGFGYDAYFVFDSKNNLDINDDGEEFVSDAFSKDVTDNSSQNKIAKDFAKFNTEKRVSRVFLNKFAEFIA
jgi:hypothetical protein